MEDIAVRRVDFGWFVRPGEETADGTARVDPVLGYLVEHPEGLLLLDTGMGSDPDADAHYRPSRRPLDAALAGAGVTVADVGLVVNCHLHFDHCGGNPLLAGRPVFVQRVELETALRTPDHTLPELVDAPGLRYEQLDGEAELMPGVRVVPTPGHTAGHQSLVVRRRDGTVVVAGQTHDTTSGWSAEVLALRARVEGHPPPLPPVADGWLDSILALDPRRVVFAHDHAIWEP